MGARNLGRFQILRKFAELMYILVTIREAMENNRSDRR